SVTSVLLFSSCRVLVVLRSFPTRRSSDLRRDTDQRLVGNGHFRLAAPPAGPALDRLEVAPLVAAHRRVEHRRLHVPADGQRAQRDRKSTRLNSSHVKNSYAVFCLKKKKQS